MEPQSLRGFTLIELLLCLCILTFLLVKTGIPDFNQSRRRLEIDGAFEELVSAVGMARSTAVAENVMVTFCRSTDGLRCLGNWENGSILFTDFNADHILNGQDRLLFRLPPLKPRGTLKFSSFRNQQYLQLTPRGATNNQNGNFTFCPADGDRRLARQLIINITARTRMARDRDHDGIVEDSQGRPLQCR